MRTTVLLVAMLLVGSMGLATAGDQTNGALAWRQKADDKLLAAYDAGQDTLTIELQGPRVPLPTDLDLEDRAAIKAYYQRMTAGFLGGIQHLAAQRGATLGGTILYANAQFVTLDRDLVPEFVGKAGVRRASLDWMGATYVLGDLVQTPGVLVNLDQTIAKVQASEMWNLGYRGEGIKLAAIDTGVRPTHEMLKNADGSSRVVGWHDTTEPASGRCATPCDTHSHGTHVTTTAAGSNLFNSNSQQGVAPRTTIIGVRIFQGGGGSWEDAQEGLQGAFDLDADISTNSWGGGCSGGGVTTAELAEDLQALGMQNVFAAGNSGAGGVICPGMVDNVVTVGAIDINENIAGFSSRGPCVWPVGSGQSRTCPDVSAVGVDVNAGCHSSDTCYTTMSGTSMATPHVAGVVVLLEQASRAERGQGLSAPGKQAEILMRYSAKDLGNGGPDNDYGWGLAKAKAARDLLANSGGLNLIHLFTVGKPVLRAYETNTVTFGVVNLGGTTVSGPMSLDIRQVDTGLCPPTCDTVAVSKGISLGPFTETEVKYAFVGSQHPAGNYLVNARLDYTYDGGSGMITDNGMFLLKKVSFIKARGVAATQSTGDLVAGDIVLRNVGNENAMNVRYTERIRNDGFVVVPQVPPGEGQWALFANPAPDNVRLLTRVNPPETLMEWRNIGSVNQGTQWTTSIDYVVGLPGTYPTRGTLTYTDEVGTAFTEAFNIDTVVSLPSPV